MVFWEAKQVDYVPLSLVRPRGGFASLEPFGEFRVNDKVEARWTDNVWYKATITSILSLRRYLVTFSEYGNIDIVKADAVRASPEWVVGDICEARWSEDGIWYKAEIIAISDSNRFRVRFTDYGNEDEVGGDAVRVLSMVTALAIPSATVKVDEAVAKEPPSWRQGDHVVAKWLEDGVWYRAIVTSVSPNKKLYDVLFTEYGNSSVVGMQSIRGLPWKVGDKCLARWTQDDVWYDATIEEVVEEGKSFRVVFPEYGNEDTVDVTSIQPLENRQSLSGSLWNVGDKCMARYTVDDVWYTAVVEKVEGDQYHVLFIDYGNREVVGADRMRALSAGISDKKGYWAAGDLCSACWSEDGVWYDAVIESVDGDKFTVLFTEYGNRDTLPASALLPRGTTDSERQRHVQSLTPELPPVKEPPAPAKPVAQAAASKPARWAVGDACSARWSEDGIWYDAVIESVSGSQYSVLFTEYGNRDTVSADGLRPLEGGSISVPAPAASVVVPRWSVGDKCQACWSEDGVWYGAVIESVSGSQYSVLFTEYGNRDTVTVDGLRPLEGSPAPALPTSSSSVAPPRWSVGDKCQARWSEDGVWYDAVIESVVGSQYQVLFTEYGNRDTVTIDALAPSGTAPGAAPMAASLPTASAAWKVGDQCEAKWSDGVWYAATIENISPEGNQFFVLFTEYGNRDIVGIQDMRAAAAPTSMMGYSVGSPCIAKRGDGLWYPGLIDRFEGDAAIVKFPAYGLREPVPLSQLHQPWREGDLCEAQWSEDSAWYSAVLLTLSPDGRQAHVRFPKYGNEDVVDITSLRVADKAESADGLSRPTWKVGDACVAQWSEDGQWYPAMVQTAAPDGSSYVVHFTEYGNSDIVDASKMKPAPQPAAASSSVLEAPGGSVTWRVGDDCEARYPADQRWYKAKIERIDGKMNLFYATFYGSGKQVGLSWTDLRPLVEQRPAAHAPVWKVGDECEACWSEDSTWYTAVIVEVMPDRQSYRVHFSEYGNESVEPMAHLRRKAAPALPSVGESGDAQWLGGDGEWYAATVTAVDAAAGLVTVTFPEYGNSDTVPASALRKFAASAPSNAAPKARFKVGQLVESRPGRAKHYERARVEAVGGNGRLVTVTFESYEGITQTVDASELRPAVLDESEKEELNVRRGRVSLDPQNTSAPLGLTMSNAIRDFVANRDPESMPLQDYIPEDDVEGFADEEPPAEEESQASRRPRRRRQGPRLFGELPEGADVGDAAMGSDLNVDEEMLPVVAHRQRILQIVANNQVTIVSGSTGSGKTTQVPQYILDDCIANNVKCNIICTQPRRIAAISVAKRYADAFLVFLFTLVLLACAMSAVFPLEGWLDTRCPWTSNPQAGSRASCMLPPVSCFSASSTSGTSAPTRISLSTKVRPSWLSTELSNRSFLCIVHERDSDTDFVLLILRELLMINPTVRVILMSATIDCDLFAAYYNSLPVERFRTAGEVPIINVEGRLYHIAVHHLDKMDNGRYLYALPPCALPGQLISTPEVKPEMFEALTELIERIHRGEWSNEYERNTRNLGAILVFLPGLGEIQELFDVIEEKLDTSSMWILPLHSTLTSEEQQRVFRRTPLGTRKVIISTNIAESSITVPDVRYVIDLGLVKELYCDQQTNLEGLRLQWSSRASGRQRAGRAGRVQDGHCFRMVPAHFWEHEINEQVVPEIQRISLDHVVLQVKVLDVGDPRNVLQLALQAPNIHTIDGSLVRLTEAGAGRWFIVSL